MVLVTGEAENTLRQMQPFSNMAHTSCVFSRRFL